MNRLKYVLSVALILVAPLLVVSKAWAASGTIYLSPGSGTFVNGGTYDVAIRENSGATQVNAVQANLSFPASLLSVVSITRGPAWGIEAQNQYNNSAGTINFAVGNIGALTGDQLVGTIRFQAKASSGTAVVSFTAGTTVTEADGSATPLNPLTQNGGSYTMSAPATPPPPTPPSPTPPPPPSPGSPSPTPTPSPSPGSPPPPTPPSASGLQITNVASSAVGTDTATITWTTSASANSEVMYGLSSGTYTYGANDGALVTNHKIVLKSQLIQPGITYHFKVKSTDGSGRSATSADYTFTTKGASVQVTVTDQNGKPVRGAKVTITYPTTTEKSVSGITDKNGQVTISGLPGLKADKVDAMVTHGGKKTTFNDLQLKPFDPQNPTQSLAFKINVERGTPFIVILIPLLLLGILAGLLWNRGKKPKDWWHSVDTASTGSSAPGISPTPTSVGDKSEPTIIRPTNSPTDSRKT